MARPSAFTLRPPPPGIGVGDCRDLVPGWAVGGDEAIGDGDRHLVIVVVQLDVDGLVRGVFRGVDESLLAVRMSATPDSALSVVGSPVIMSV